MGFLIHGLTIVKFLVSYYLFCWKVVSYYLVLLICIYILFRLQTICGWNYPRIMGCVTVCVSPSMTISIIYVALNYLWASETGSGRFYMATLQILSKPHKQKSRKPSRSMVRGYVQIHIFFHSITNFTRLACFWIVAGREHAAASHATLVTS